MSDKPASISALNSLHSKFAKYLETVLDEATEGAAENRIPLDAATMGCISKFLKDNNISAEPADKATLESLREKFSRRKKDTPVSEIIANASNSLYTD